MPIRKQKRVLIISASFRPKSNSHALCLEVAKGVRASGNKAEVIRLKDKNIGFCTGCYACRETGKCVNEDDANAIVEKICDADAVVFGTPVYYYTISGQLKTLLDRCVSKWPQPDGKPYYLVATMAENKNWDLVKAPVQGFVDCFEGAKLKGFIKAGNVYEQGAVLKTKYVQQAYDLGMMISTTLLLLDLNATKFDVKIKSGRGNQGNSCDWSVTYDKKQDIYVAMLSLSSAYGCSHSFYEISKEIYDNAGTFKNDDYKTEDLIRSGRRLYKYENERNYIEPVEIVDDKNYRKLCKILLEKRGN